MLLALQGLLAAAEVAELRRIAAEGEFIDGGVSSPGLAAAGIKRNEQMSLASAQQRRVEEIVLSALDRNETFRTAAIPKLIRPPILSRYRPGMAYGTHIDNPIMRKPVPMRLDLSITAFLSDPENYRGGERLAAVTWIQSMVHEQTKRTMLYDLAVVTQWVNSVAPQSPYYHRLNNTRANLIRMWAID